MPKEDVQKRTKMDINVTNGQISKIHYVDEEYYTCGKCHGFMNKKVHDSAKFWANTLL